VAIAFWLGGSVNVVNKKISLGKVLAVLSLVGVWGPANAQFTSQNCSLYANLNPAFFGSSSGNDCWGYVSPSGREYAIMGLNNKVAFVEITNPASPVVVSTIPHTSSTWGGLKVYQNFCYASTETAGTGLQVIDLSLIDAGIVTLVRTIPSPGRTHTLTCDPVSGFLYTCGSRDGTGTTTCFDLTNPSDPAPIGLPTLTTNYQHESTCVTYTTGPLAGRQIWFGFSEGRGVDVYDVTNKSAPVLLKRITYPNIGYCHQGWLSADRKYLYVDDEFDESNLNVPTRSLVFNVEDPANGFFVGTFSTGEAAIDHNQYVRDGFIFQANYRSGLRVFEQQLSPEIPYQTGFFDTYPEDNLRGYQGAWSNFSFFPSGTSIVSDINRGLFVINVLDATTRHLAPDSFSIPLGTSATGGLLELAQSDNSRLILSKSTVETDEQYPLLVTVSRTAVDANPNRLRVVVESSGLGESATNQNIELFDWTIGGYQPINSRVIGPSDSSVTTNWVSNPTRFVNPTTKEIRCRIHWSPSSSDSDRIYAGIDQVRFDVTL
jgi:choice-of-anchor B domain-containing protein